jgi:tRNA-dihydrouridine synthase A
MIVTGALIHGDAPHFLNHRSDEPASLQLGGSNPGELARCAALVEESGYQEVNLNVGCPSDRVQYGGIGACLMAEPDLIAECFTVMQEKLKIPVTIKCRIGIDDKDSYDNFLSFIKPVYEAGCRTFIVHARKAILKGLSPKDNREIPPLKYEYVYQIQQDYPQAAFVLNGGLKTAEQTLEQLKQVKGVMLGRAAYSNPWILAELEESLFGTLVPSRKDTAIAYRAYMVEEMATGVQFKHMAKHLLGLFTGVPGARAFRRHLSEQMYSDDTEIDLLDEALAHIQLPGSTLIRETNKL